MVKVVINSDFDAIIPTVFNCLDAGKALELFVIRLVLLAVGQVVGDVTVSDIDIFAAGSGHGRLRLCLADTW